MILWQRKAFYAKTQEKLQLITDPCFPLCLPVNGKVQTKNKKGLFHSKKHNVEKN